MLPGRKFLFLGQPSNAAFAVTSAGALQAGPAAAPTLAAATESGTANAAVTTANTTLTDTRKTWLVNEWAGSTITCNGKTLLVVSNTATVATGLAWSGGGNPGNGFAWSLATPLSTAPSGYTLGYSWVYNTTAPQQETPISPLAQLAVTAGQKITYVIPAFPGSVVAANVYVWAAPLGPPEWTRGFKRSHAAAGTYDFAANTVTTEGLFPPSFSEQFGSFYLPVINPTGLRQFTVSCGAQAAVAANTDVERILAVTGVLAGDIVISIQKPTDQAGLMVQPQRVSSAGNIGMKYINNTAASITPTNENYVFTVLSSPTIATVTLINTQLAAKSRLFFAIRQGSTTPDVACEIVVHHVATLTPGLNALIAFKNIGSKPSLATDFICDYLILDGGL